MNNTLPTIEEIQKQIEKIKQEIFDKEKVLHDLLVQLELLNEEEQ